MGRLEATLTQARAKRTKLTGMEESFCQAKASGLSATKSAIAAGYKPAGAAVTGSRMTRKPKIMQRLEELGRETSERLDMDRAGHIERLGLLSQEARAKGQYGSALKGEELIGRCLGYYTEQSVTVGVSVSASVENANPAELRQALAESLDRFGIDLSTLAPAATQGTRQGTQPLIIDQGPQEPGLPGDGLTPNAGVEPADSRLL